MPHSAEGEFIARATSLTHPQPTDIHPSPLKLSGKAKGKAKTTAILEGFQTAGYDVRGVGKRKVRLRMRSPPPRFIDH